MVTRPVMPRAASRCGCRDRQLSTTIRTPGTVIDDSASEVATMMRGTPRCTTADHGILFGRRDLAVQLPHVEGAVQSADASGDLRHLASARGEHEHVGFGVFADQLGGGGGGDTRDVVEEAAGDSPFVEAGRGTRSPALGEGEGCDVMVDDRRGDSAVPMTAASRAASRVADIATTTRSSRSSRTSESRPTRRSVSRARSCTSSMMTALTPSSPGSSSNRRRSTPAVTNSTLVSGPAVRSPRTVKPTRDPERGAIEVCDSAGGGTRGDPAGLGDDHAVGGS